MLIVEKAFLDSIEIKQIVNQQMSEQLEKYGMLIYKRVSKGNKILICGNGGSAADAQHFAAELIVRYENERKSIPAIALTTDSSIITACANDYSYDKIFSRQIEALGTHGDILIGISTSGNSKNILQAFKVAKNKNMITFGLTGNNGGKMISMEIDNMIIIPSNITARIQEVHELILHSWCELIDREIANTE